MPTRIKRYEERAERLDQLLARIEAEMGPEAEVERRDFVRGRVLGLFGGTRMVEVIATLEVDTTPGAFVRPAGPTLAIPGAAEAVLPPEPAPAAWQSPRATPPAAPAPPLSPEIIPAKRQTVELQAEEPASPEPAWEDAAPAVAAAPPAPVPETPSPEEAPPLSTTSDMLDLKSSILELQQNMRFLIEQQHQILTNAAPVVEAAGSAPAGEAPGPGANGIEASTPPSSNAPPNMVAPSAVPTQRSMPFVVDPFAIDPAAMLEGIQRGAYDKLLDWNVGPYDALDLINTALANSEAQPPQDIHELLSRITADICRNILLSGGIKLRRSPPGKVVALIGATGVGKTTTIAKLAANFAFQQGKRVSLVSLDNYRIAAAEQLRTYTDIMGIDLDIVFSRDELDQVLSVRRHNDIVLIDTAGRSPLNVKQIDELRDLFSAHPPDEIHLVLAAPTKADDLRMIIENFLPLSYDYIIVSKLDETRSLGCLYNISKHSPLIAGRDIPISYFTVGQSVPEDIRTAELPFIQAWIEQGRII
jgi:signal recognition particle GTPase